MQWEDENFTDSYTEDSTQDAEELLTYPEEYVEEFQLEQPEEDPLSLTHEEESLLGTAMIRLDQARLYEMLVKHDLFEGVQANPIALKAVQKEIKTFIMDRLEILLGLKQEKFQKNKSSDFNDLEVQTLKDLAFAASKGATRKLDANTSKNKEITPQREGLKPFAPKTISKPTQQAPKPIQAPIKQNRPTHGPRNAQNTNLKAKQNKNDFPTLQKNVKEMSHDELVERAKITSDIYKGRVAVNSQALPPPSFEQQMLQYSAALSGNTIGAQLMKHLGGNGVYDVGDGE